MAGRNILFYCGTIFVTLPWNILFLPNDTYERKINGKREGTGNASGNTLSLKRIPVGELWILIM